MFQIARDRNLLLDFLAILFGTASWISINGIWVELPLLVNVLPESWSLASYLSIIVQIANLGPILYSFLRWQFKDRISKVFCIYVLLFIGTLSSILLALFWQETSYIGGELHSTALFVLVFCLSLVDCTSSVLFLPFMAMFREIYLNSYLIGEGMSGLLPALVALAQGVGGNPYCDTVRKYNETTESWEEVVEAVYPEPRFSVEAYFFILMGIMLLSSMAFVLLNTLSQFKSEKVNVMVRSASSSSSDMVGDTPVQDNEEQFPPKSASPAHKEYQLSQQQTQSNEEQFNIDKNEDTYMPISPDNCLDLTNNNTLAATRKFYLLLSLQTFICFWCNGALPSIQTYSCLPYGNVVYHLAVTLSSMASPIMAFLANFFPCRRIWHITLLTGIGSLFSAFILATALYSPEKLWGQDVGGAFTVISWVIYGGLFSFVRISIAGWCRQRSDSSLFWYGAWTQIGSAFGSGVMFVIVNYTETFEQYYVVCEAT